MKTRQLLLSGTMVMVALSITFTSCRKKEKEDDDTSGAQDNALVEGSFNDIGQISDEAAKGSVSSYKNTGYETILSHCATVKFDTLNSADDDSITVDFGSTNCLCHDNRTRRGKLYITYTAGKKYWDSLAVITIKTAPTNNYFVNDHQVIGTKTITNKGHNSSGNMNWDISVSGQIIKANGQGSITWNSTRNREWIAGENTPINWTDDVYSVTGSATGTSAAGNNFTATITSALIRKMNCWWISSGTFSFDPGNGKPIRYVDFSPKSNGLCDNWVSITINGKTYYKQI